jgi:hypothetical protein
MSIPVYTSIVVTMDETTLSCGDPINSPNKKFSLVFRDDGNLVLYENSGGSRTGKWNSETADTGANRVVSQGDGNVVVYKDQDPEWGSGTADVREAAPFIMCDRTGVYNPDPFNNSDVARHNYTGVLFLVNILIIFFLFL